MKSVYDILFSQYHGDNKFWKKFIYEPKQRSMKEIFIYLPFQRERKGKLYGLLLFTYMHELIEIVIYELSCIGDIV